MSHRAGGAVGGGSCAAPSSPPHCSPIPSEPRGGTKAAALPQTRPARSSPSRVTTFQPATDSAFSTPKSSRETSAPAQCPREPPGGEGAITPRRCPHQPTHVPHGVLPPHAPPAPLIPHLNNLLQQETARAPETSTVPGACKLSIPMGDTWARPAWEACTGARGGPKSPASPCWSGSGPLTPQLIG